MLRVPRTIIARHAAATAALAVTALVGTATPLHGQAPPAGTTGTQAAVQTAAVPPAVAAARQSWTSDRRDYVVGDLVTVLIDDYTMSTAIKENIALDSRSRGLSASVRLPGSSKNVGIDARNSADQQQRGSARRENRFQNELSVRIVEIAPNGLLQLKGTKNINVDKSSQDVVFTGWVRPQDISSSNMVESNRIADAQLAYTSPGPLGKPKQGMISKILGAFWP